MPLDRARIFEAIVSDANRSGVTFYTVDTRGLMEAAARPIVPSLTQLDRAASSSAQQGALNAGRLSGAQNIQGAFDTASQMDDVQLLAVSNTQLALQELAVRTGGFAVANTNEIAKPMQQVMEEIRTHYELAYAPKSSVYDGHFRKIEVKVDRPRATVQSRKGYYALPDLNGEPVQAFEMTALTAMEVRPAPRDFPYSVSMMQFRPGPESIQCEVAFEVPVAGLRISNDGKAGTSRVQASVMALIQDLNGAVVSKVSRQLFRTVPNKDLPAFKQEKIEYAEPVKLAPGRYTLNTAVLDGEGNTVAAQRISVFVRAVSDLALSSLELVKRVEPLQSERDPLNPFEMEGRRVTLTLADEVASGKPLDLYFVVYPQRDATSEAPKLLVELMKDGKEVAGMTPALPKPDATGAIPMVAELQPPAGYYDIRVTVRQGKLAAQATRALTVQ